MIQTDPPHPQNRKPNLVLINKKKRVYPFVDFPVPADHRMKIEESEKLTGKKIS